MKKLVCVLSVILATGFAIYYMHFGGLLGNKSALSTVGLEHHALFWIWGLTTYFALFINIITSLPIKKYKFHIPLLIISLIGMIMTLSNDFDYYKHSQYIAHCIGSLMFSAITGILVVALFFVLKRWISMGIASLVLIADLVLLIIFKETALIEITPIFTGYILLLINNLSKEKEKIEIN